MRTSISALALSLALSTTGAGLALADETAAARNAKVSISQAIEAAEQKGGKATEAEFSDDNGGRWQVKVVADGGNKLTEYYVDPSSGKVTGQEEQTFEKYFSRLKPENFAKSQTQIKDAIKAAEELGKGKAIDAEVKRDSDAVSYEIDVSTTDGTKKEITVDAAGKASES